MRQNFPLPRLARHFLSSALLSAIALTFVQFCANAQSTYPPCEPPLADEYLVLVETETPAQIEEVLTLLRGSINATACNYLNETVTRIGGFDSFAVANEWAQYVGGNLGVATFVARPPGANPAEVVPSSPSPNSPSYNPEPLGSGYAVLVDFFNNPQVATQLREFLNKEIDLVSYGQRPYLLAEYTENQGKANRVLQTLSDRGFWVTVVDSRNVILLDTAVGGE